MPDWGNAPMTRTALWESVEEQGPSALEREWASLLRGPGDVIFMTMGAFRRMDGRHGGTWTALSWHVREGDKVDESPVLAVPAMHVERLLVPLAHEARVRVMQTLYRGPRSAEELSEATGLGGGDLHHHLSVLLNARCVDERDFRYGLTDFGCQMLITMASIAAMAVRDRGEEGLVIRGFSGD